jgi:hypothetical protein
MQPQDIRRWAKGQRLAEKVVEAERRRLLRELDQESILRIYLDLAAWPVLRPQGEVSPLLAAMRLAVSRLTGQERQ